MDGEPTGAAARILVVHGEPRDERTVEVLSGIGYDVRGVACGAGGLRAVRDWAPHLVIVDIATSGAACAAELRQIRQTARTHDVPVIAVIPAGGWDEIAAEEVEALVEVVFTRPLADEELLTGVRSMLRARALAGRLRESERRFHDLLAHQPDGVLLVDENGVIRFANPAAHALLGQSLGPLEGLPFGHPLEGEDDAALTLVGPDGATRVVTMRVASTTWQGHPAWLATLRDDTESRNTRARLREQAALLNRTQDAILVLTRDWTVSFWSEGATKLFGPSAEEMVGAEVLHLFVDADPARVAMAGVLENDEWRGELALRGARGAAVVVDARWSLVRDEEGVPARVLCVLTDVSEQKRLQAQFLRAQRLESVGRLAGGIAHDLNNVLAPILLSLGSLRRRVTDAGELAMLETIEENTRQGVELVKQVLLFSRGRSEVQAPMDLAALVSEMAGVVRDTFPKDIALELRLPSDLWKVVGNTAQIHQLLMNLTVNARDAMKEEGGLLTVQAENLDLDEQYLAGMGTAEPGRYVRLTVRDTGVGMSPEVQEKAFEPFYTTKDVGEGTGLGLSTVDSIVRSHGGVLTLRSAPGEGTTFQVLLPAVVQEEPAEPEEARREPSPDSLRGDGELILVVDDERAVREVTSRTLHLFGYQSLDAADGTEAVAIYGSERSRISAVILDMRMPVMDGPATVRALRRIDPDVRILGSSGFFDADDLGEGGDLHLEHFLAKPYTAERLLEALRRVLDS